MARVTGLEPATSGVTGRHSNRLSYTRALLDHREAIRSLAPPERHDDKGRSFENGASDGARTRDLRRDRPAL